MPLLINALLKVTCENDQFIDSYIILDTWIIIIIITIWI